MTIYINAHTLHTHAVSNLNRDDNGEQKSCIFGGLKRARLSSQCQKYYARHSEMIKQFAENHGFELSIRTIKTEELANLVNANKKDIETHFGDGALLAVGKNEAKKIIDGDLKIDEAQMPLDVALFGRMFAKRNHRSDGACTVINSFTTNSIEEGEYDWFTATDDLSEAGSGHLNARSFSTGTFYKNMSINVDLLAKNLNVPISKAIDLATDLLYLINLTSIESNKANSDNFTLPSFMIMEVANRPVSYSNIFEKPCFEDEAISRLMEAPFQLVQNLLCTAEILGTEVNHSIHTIINKSSKIEPSTGLNEVKIFAKKLTE